jgi:hypothetical protein
VATTKPGVSPPGRPLYLVFLHQVRGWDTPGFLLGEWSNEFGFLEPRGSPELWYARSLCLSNSMKSSTGLFTCSYNAPLAHDPLVHLRVSREEFAGIAVSPQSPLFSYCTSGFGRCDRCESASAMPRANFRMVFGLSFLALLRRRFLDLTEAVLHRANALSNYSKPNFVCACVSIYVCFCIFCGHASVFGWGEGDGRRGHMHHAHAPNTKECG